jgi:cytochrome c-type biogenesis protein CcmE
MKTLAQKRKLQRFWFLAILVVSITGVVGLVLNALDKKISYFYYPSDVIPLERTVRLGGLVSEGSLLKVAQGQSHYVQFTVEDENQQKITVRYKGLLPDLFREGQGIIAEGRLLDNRIFEARQILAKHDENYMPPEVSQKIKTKGLWKANQRSQL